jgi:phospholipid/cholesterol/gamma-HCH transport system permease protein
VAKLGRSLLMAVAGFGKLVQFCLLAFAAIPSVRVWTRHGRLSKQLFFVGTMSAPVVAITGIFLGMILGLEGFRQFQSIGQEGRLGGIINVSMVKQLGPVLAAIMLAGRVGCSLTAELGSMRVTEQLDAMRALGSDPIKVLVVPRFLACMLMIPALTIISNICGVVGGFIITTKFYDADPQLYWKYSAIFVGWFDIVNGLIKSVFFGAGIGLISCYKGFTCRPGAEGVGRATTESFVMSFICIIIMSVGLVKVLNDIEIRIGGGVTSVFT